jgi:hypothetical protein
MKKEIVGKTDERSDVRQVQKNRGSTTCTTPALTK